MDKWGVENQICVKITIYKGCNDGEVIYYRNKLPMWIIEQWRWYFDYIAALVKVNNPRRKVELITCAQTLKQGQEYIEEKSKTLLRAKETKLKRLENTPVQNDLFNNAKEEQDKKIQAVQGEINAIKRGEFNYYVPPTYINKIKKWIKR
ncbi:hypothetical protein [Bacteroides sp.]|uniref:hypothetical protein n=1 Tax=Bacteroides sp. TaxID=29523 RepID=UPI003AB05A8E